MHERKPFRRAAPRARFALAAVLGLLAAAPLAQAAPLSQSDLALALYTSPDGASWTALGANALPGFFGPHRCLCPAQLLVQVQLTAAGQANLGNSTLTADFRLGSACSAAPTSCPSLGQVSFSRDQTAASPTFTSDLVFKTAAGGIAVSCGSLVAGGTTLWALLAQDGVTLPFVLQLALPVTATSLAAPTATTAEPADGALQVSWTPPSESTRVAAYQVLCLPRASAAYKAGYESCGLTATTGATSLTAADTTQLCSAAVSASTTSARITGLTNGTAYTVAVVAIDASGGVSALSPPAQAIPQPTLGFYEKYKQAGGAATGCALGRSPGGPGGLLLALLGLALLRLRRRGRRAAVMTVLAALVLGSAPLAQAQVARYHSSDEWAAKPSPQADFVPVEWGLEVGISLYRPAVDSELEGAKPFAETFGNARRFMSELELVRYLGHGRLASWGVGLRLGYYKNYADAFLPDGSRSGDETSLRLIPVALSAIYRVTEIPGVRRVLIPYAKAGLDGVVWTASSSGASGSESAVSLGWHAAAGLVLSLSFIAGSGAAPGAIAGPGALFFEWDYAAINGLGLGSALHVGDSTWFAGLMFDL